MEWLEYESLEPLFEIADMIEGVSAHQLSEWERRLDSFPKPKEVQGRYKFFDPDEVKKWVHLHRKATKRMGRGDELNAKREGSADR